MPARRLLDQIQTLATLAAFDAGDYTRELEAELPADLAALDAVLSTALRDIDELAARIARLQLDHALADDTSIGPPTRRVFATTITAYAANLPLLHDRVRDVAARGGSREPDAIAERVVDAARATLALRASLHDSILALAHARAEAAIADADRRARDRSLDEPERRRWSAIRRELEAIAASPARIASTPWATRLASWPDQLDESTTREPTREELLELD
jgi:hypothetical protein